MSKCCEKKVFKCNDMDGVGKIFVRTNATIKAEAPIRFKTDSGYVQETTFEKGVDISINLDDIPIDLSNYVTKQDAENTYTKKSDANKLHDAITKETETFINGKLENYASVEWVRENYVSIVYLDSNYLKNSDADRQYLQKVDYNVDKATFLTKTEAEKTYIKKGEISGNSSTVICERTYVDVVLGAQVVDINGLKISFERGATVVRINFHPKNVNSGSFTGLRVYTIPNTSTQKIEVNKGLDILECFQGFLSGMVEQDGTLYSIKLTFDDGSNPISNTTKISFYGSVTKG